MARNLTGMFAQLNEALGGSPLAQLGTGPRAADRANPLLMGGMLDMTGRDEFMTTPQRDAKIATMEAQSEQTMAQVERIRKREQKKQALIVARDNEDTQSMRGIMSGAIDPAQYLADQGEDFTLPGGAARYDAKGNLIANNPVPTKPVGPFAVSDGADLVDADGTLLHSNPKTPTSAGRLPATALKIYDEHRERANKAGVTYARLEGLEDSLANTTFEGGAATTAGAWLRETLGEQSKVEDLRTEFFQIRNSEAMNNLPPGTASDADVALAMAGFPNDGASPDYLARWIKGYKKLVQHAQEYSLFTARYMDSTGGNMIGVQTAWDNYNEQREEQQKRDRTPQIAIDALLQEPTEERQKQFKDKFGWLPPITGQ